MRRIHTGAGILVLISTILILLISTIELAAYGDWSYYEKEYRRLQVLDTVPMEMDDLMDVTHEMMDYLRGDRDDLVVMTVIDGREQEFFNEQEKIHMYDVRNLFLGGLAIRKISAVILILCLIFLIGSKAPLSSLLPRCFLIGIPVMVAVVGILGGLFAANFTRCFTIFHKIFFRNDLWIMDPATSNLINIVPEPFWSAIALRIALIFVGFLAVVMIGSLIWLLVSRRKSRPMTH